MQGYRLSAQQERLWRFHQGGMPAYATAVVELQGLLDPDRLKRALERVVGRHQILRTTYRRAPGVALPVQVIGEGTACRWDEVELDGSGDALDRMVRRVLAEPSEPALDLESGPLMRVALTRIDGRSNLLSLCLPALTADGTTLDNLIGEIAAEYGNGDGSVGAGAPEEVVQYLQFSEWQYEVLEEIGPAAFDLPGERDPGFPWETPATAAGLAAYRTDAVAGSLSGEVQDLASSLAERVAAEAWLPLLAAWHVLVCRLSGRPDAVVGMVSHGRLDEELNTAAGLFSRVLPLGCTLAPETRFVEVIERLREPVSEAVEVVGVAAAGAEPVATVGFEYRARRTPAEACGLRVKVLGQRAVLEPFKIKLDLVRSDEGLRAELEYDVGRYRRSDVGRMLAAFETLAAEALARPELAVRRLPAVGPGECHRLVTEWNQTQAPYPRNLCIHDLFETRVALAPEAPAVVSQDARWTYAELDRRAARVAARLRGAGAGPERRVAVLVERSPEMVAAVLGILKAGAAYVPLDPGSPPERVSYVLADAGAEILVTREGVRPAAEGFGGTTLLLDHLLDGDVDAADGGGGRAAPESLAYVLYTSGSTGRPKGTLMSHRAVVNYLAWCAETYELAEGRGVPLHSPLGFDLTVTSLLAPLAAGQRIVLLPEDQSLEALHGALRVGRDFSLLKLTPSHLAALRPLLEVGDVAGTVRSLVVGGEALHAETLGFWRESAPGTRIFNEYGPTEAAVGCAVFEVAAAAPRRGDIPIGRPIANARLLVLDGDLGLVPTGCEGELFIGGDGLARGYRGLAARTAERFLPDPFGRVGDRLYRTGDLVRHLAEGDLVFLGRRDQQVKIRGHRVELGEIEAVLSEHPQVREAVAALRTVDGRQRLAGYCVPRIRGVLDATEVLAFLADRLPEFMVPAVLVPLEALPLTSRGKVDRQALPDPERAERGRSASHRAPQTAAEVILARIWTDVLGIEEVGLRDNFFELGGDSILGIQVVAKAIAAGIHLMPRQLFQYRTLEELAAAAGSEAEVTAEQGVVTGDVPLSPIQRWFFETYPLDPHHFNQAVLLETRRRLDPSYLRAALGELSRHHDALRARFLRRGDGWRQVQVAPEEGAIELTTVDLSRLTPARPEVVGAVARAAQESLDLGRGPLVRAVLMDLGEGPPGRLLLVCHHLVIDGVAWRILLDDLQAAYDRLRRSMPASLPPKTTSYKEWAERLEELVRSDRLAPEVEFWAAGERAAVPPLPVDFPSGSNRVASVRSVRVALDEARTDRLLREVLRDRGVRIQDLLLSALAAALRSWMGGDLLLVDLEGHGRDDELVEDTDLSRTVGWFASIYPLLLDLRGAEGPAAVLDAVQEQSRAVPHGGIGYGLLRYMHPDPGIVSRLAAMPRAQVMFEYLGQLDRALAADAAFAPARETKGEEVSPRAERPHLLEVVAEVAGGRLSFEWAYSEELHRRETVERLAGRVIEELEALMREVPEAAEERVPPAVDSFSGLDPRQLEALRSQVGFEDAYPLSPVQEGMLFETLSDDPAARLYLDQSTCRLDGELHADAFRRACELAVERHASLRTTFLWKEPERPLQVVHPRLTLPWDSLDWRDGSPEEQAERLEAFLQADRERGFDLARGPLVRMALVRLGETSHQLVWTLHHLILDGWSLSLLLEEVMATYRDLERGHRPDLPPAPRYRDFIRWLEEREEGAAERYWRRALEGFTDPTPLPWEAPDPGSPSGQARFEERSFEVSARTTVALREIARRHGLTLGTLVEGAWALVLGLAAGRDDVAFGSIVFGRPAELPDVASMVGLFINTLPTRVRIRRDQPVVEWLRALQAERAEQRQYEHTPLTALQRWSEVPRGLPLFSSIVNFISFEGNRAGRSAPVQDAGLVARDLRFFLRVNYPLSISVSPGPDRLEVRLRYDRSRFGEAAASRTIEELVRLFRRLPAEGDGPVGALHVPGREERHQLVREWGGTPVGAEPVDVVALFERQAECRPSEPALVFEDLSLTYGELERRANRLASALGDARVGPEVRVGVLAERSWQSIVALLAVLKAGGAYVPLDPELPRERATAVLADAQVSVVVAPRGSERSILGEVPVLLVDPGDGEAGAGPEPRPDRAVRPETLAYVLFTSGSTGRPKGVAVARRQLASYVGALLARLDLPAGASFANVSTLAADLGNTAIFGALCSGGCLHVVSRETGTDPGAMAGYAEAHRIDCLKIVPSHLSGLLAAPRPERVIPHRWLVLGGETLRWGDVEEVHRLAPGCAVLNHYGPTEATVGVSVHRVDREGVRPHTESVPIGRPLANSSLHVLGGGLEPVVRGVPGEIHIGGAGVARGYWRQPRPTAESFVPDPFARVAGSRLYRTGDHGCHLSDGSLVFLGRRDHQVKVRGHRVELAEVEGALRRHPGVRDVVVLAEPDGGGQRLRAFVAPRAAPAAGAAGHRLPNGMVVSGRNLRETEALYDEIFVRRAYLHPELALPESPVVFDVGANIGMFSILVGLLRPRARIFAFEPIPQVFEDLTRNAALVDAVVEARSFGLSHRSGPARFTYVPRFTQISGLSHHVEVSEEIEVVRRYLENERGSGDSASRELLEIADDLLPSWLEGEAVDGRVERLSDVVRREGVGRIDLLKIDVQRAEREVLAGIEPDDWRRIGQIVLEVHDAADGEGGSGTIRGLLEERGYRVWTERGELQEGTGRFLLYGRRADLEVSPGTAMDLDRDLDLVLAAPAGRAPGTPSADELRTCVRSVLPEPMVPSDLVILDALPLTPNGKVDREALRRLGPEAAAAPAAGSGAPRSPLEEELVELWKELLGTETIGVHDDFFNLGGHSLLVMQLIGRLRRRYEVELSLRTFLDAPTVAGLSVAIARESAAALGADEVETLLAELEDGR